MLRHVLVRHRLVHAIVLLRTMSYRAIRVTSFGDPHVMKVEEQPEILAGDVAPNELVIDIHAAGVNPVDTYFRSGLRGGVTVPYTPGSDAAGVVSLVGSQVQRWKVGDRVYTSGMKHGAYAQKARVTEEQLQPLPDTVSFYQGAGLHVPYATAYYALFQRAAAKPGETVLVHGASGGVGIASVQWAKSRGLTVFATAGTQEGLELVRQQGADRVFSHRQEGYQQEILAATGGRGVDVVLEMLANVNLNEDMLLMAKRGRICVIGNRGSLTVDPRRLMGTDSTIIGIMLYGATPAEQSEIHAAIQSGLSIGTLKPVVGRVFKLSEAPESHEFIIHGSGATGKVVLDTQNV